MKKIKLSAVVVLYHPDEKVCDNIRSYAKDVDLLIIWNNSPETEFVLSDFDSSSIEYMTPKTNMGLAYAYNRAIDFSVEQGCTHIMTMDQDSSFEDFTILKSSIEKQGGVVILCPSINYTTQANNKNEKVTWAAQSGCIFPLEVFEKVGGFREDFFIGMVDVEMQMKAQMAGYEMLQITGCNLVHQVGSGRVVRKFGHRFMVSDYNPLRHYYDSRNRILMWREFPDDYDLKGKLHHFRSRLSVCFKILLAEDDKRRKIWTILRGTFNGLFNRIIPY